jgi:predicted phosphate transport protein (TIGR00153 family)
MRLGLGPGSGEVYDLLGAAGKAVVDVAKLVERRFREWPNGPSQDEVKALEHEADRVVSELLVNVNAQFVTPYDRDDLVRLAFAVDDVADAAENAAELLGLYGVVSPTKQSFELVGLLVQACEHLAVLLGGLHDRERSEAEIVAIKTVEDEADVAARAARASLFKDDAIDPMIVIRWKGIYEALEDAVDACETAAHRVGNILVKNA